METKIGELEEGVGNNRSEQTVRVAYEIGLGVGIENGVLRVEEEVGTYISEQRHSGYEIILKEKL